jgi:hypothetical protein
VRPSTNSAAKHCTANRGKIAHILRPSARQHDKTALQDHWPEAGFFRATNRKIDTCRAAEKRRSVQAPKLARLSVSGLVDRCSHGTATMANTGVAAACKCMLTRTRA